MSSNLPLKKNFGNDVFRELPQLARQLDEMYTDIANALNLLVKRNIVTGADPQADAQVNSFFGIGDMTIRTDTNAVWVMTSRTTPNIVVWTLVS